MGIGVDIDLNGTIISKFTTMINGIILRDKSVSGSAFWYYHTWNPAIVVILDRKPLELPYPVTDSSLLVATALTTICLTMQVIFTWAGMILSSGWEVWNAAIATCLISVVIFELLWVQFLFPPFLLLQSSAFLLLFGQSWIIFRTQGFFLIFLHSSLKKNLFVSKMSTPLHNLVLLDLSSLTCDTFRLLW